MRREGDGVGFPPAGLARGWSRSRSSRPTGASGGVAREDAELIGVSGRLVCLRLRRPRCCNNLFASATAGPGRPGAFHFLSAHERMPHKNARSLNVPALLPGTKRGNVEGFRT